MYGDEAERKTPRAIRKLLVDYGGKTSTGLPMWRLVQAGDCRILCQGKINHFPRGVELDINTKPVRIGGGRVLLPRYRDIDPTAWILQKWFPPSTWGTAVDWAGNRDLDGNGRLFVQEFPEGGDYFLIAGPWPTVEEAGDLRIAIHLYLARELKKRRDVESVIRQRMAEEMADREFRLRNLEREFTRAEIALTELQKTISPDAQMVRDRMAAQAGVVGHMSASEDWG